MNAKERPNRSPVHPWGIDAWTANRLKELTNQLPLVGSRRKKALSARVKCLKRT